MQLLIRVRELDIDQYLEQIANTKTLEKEVIYKEQISHYCEFIQKLVAGNKILSRRFYVVIPYHPDSKNHDFALIKEQLNLNRDIVMRGIEKLGMKAKQLTSLEILDLFYSFYNPAQSKTQALKGQTIQALLNTHNV